MRGETISGINQMQKYLLHGAKGLVMAIMVRVDCEKDVLRCKGRRWRRMCVLVDGNNGSREVVHHLGLVGKVRGLKEGRWSCWM